MTAPVLVAAFALGCAARRPAAHDSALAQRTAEEAEDDPHFRPVVAVHADRIGCVAEVFGSDPADQPRVVYAHLFCAGVPADGDPVHAETMITPAAVTFDADPAVVVPTEGGDWTAAVHRVIPKQWWSAAESGSADPEALKAQLDRRLAALG